MCHLPDTPPTTYRSLLVCHSREQIRQAVRTRVLDVPFRGAYVGGNRADGPEPLVRAAQLSTGRDLPPAFHSAAAIHGFGVLDDGRVHLVGEEVFDHAPRPRLLVHSTARPPRLVRVGGIDVVTAERAAIDLARLCHPADGLAVVDAALRCGAVTRSVLTAELSRHDRLRGVHRARWVVEHAHARAESPQESRLRWIAIAAGLPVLELQVELPTEVGLFRFDLGWRERRVGVEYDGDGHATRSLLRYDRRRLNAVGDELWRLLFFVDHDVPSPRSGRPSSSRVLAGRRRSDCPCCGPGRCPAGSTGRRPDAATPSTKELWWHDTPRRATTTP